MGKHDMGTPINESLERHYQEQIKLLENKLSEAKNLLGDAKADLEKMSFRMKEKDAYIEELRKALVEQTILATARK